MIVLRCPDCRHTVKLDALRCPGCDHELAFHAPSLAVVTVPEPDVEVGEHPWRTCSNRARLGCTWLADAELATDQCFACQLTRRRPAPDDDEAWGKLARALVPKHRLLVQLAVLGLPVTSHRERAGGLAFDLLSSRSGNGSVTIGHAGGLITIDLAETLDDHREAMRVQLDEPYRTMLGHFRHEVGHYYQGLLVTGERLESCRALFGDERASYSDALDRHYAEGPPPDWAASHISAYATMHPWEDFAETFAHYLHISDTLATVALGGVVLKAERANGGLGSDVTPRSSYLDADLDAMLADWSSLSTLLNRASRALGNRDLYPFAITEPVARKLAFVHDLVRDAHASTERPVLV